jgi:hypothetical protein
MKKIKSFEDLEKYKSILKKIRKVYSEVLNTSVYDLSLKDSDDFIHLGGLTFHKYSYHRFIEKLEDIFGISLIDEFWSDEEDFKDLTDEKYATFDGIAEYIFSQSNS